MGLFVSFSLGFCAWGFGQEYNTNTSEKNIIQEKTLE